ncbi:MAG: cell envelope integrity protein CreD [Patescibacteria group bacterium]
MAEKIKRSIIARIVIIGVLVLILLIPTAMIREMINEREARRNEAMKEAGSKWGDPQLLAGPILMVPYKIITEQEKGKKPLEEIKSAYFLPQSLNISGSVSPHVLRRGIYEVVAYGTDLKFEGKFNTPDFKNLNISDANVLWDRAEIAIGLADMRGVNNDLKIKWNGGEHQLKTGTISGLAIDESEESNRIKENVFEEKIIPVNELKSGVSAKVPLDIKTKDKTYNYSFGININGSDNLTFLPLGSETNVELTSDWKTPSFDGAFLPDEREITGKGFKAKWKVLQLNRSFPESWTEARNIANSTFGVRLLVPVDEYQKNTRSIKYSIMLIALTFLIFFFIEVFNRVKIHPIQYLLTGLALVLFYSLLLSISEHLNFDKSYLIASASTILMVTLYSKTIFKSIKLALVQGGLLLIMYSFIYTILQLEDYSLLIGNAGLFLVLAIVMYLSRNIDWYNLMDKEVK